MAYIDRCSGLQLEDLTHWTVHSRLSFQVHDVRFQTQTAEEKEAWIKALSNGISRAKNKIFDEVYISLYFLNITMCGEWGT